MGKVDLQRNILCRTGLLDMVKNEAKKAGKRMLETNFVHHAKMVERIFLLAVENEEMMELLLRLRIICRDGKEDFYRYIKSSMLAIATGINLHLSHSELVLLARAALLYDVGNCIFDEDILNGNEILSQKDKKKLAEHVIIGFQLLQDYFPKEICLPAYQHHERFDGSGYPNGIDNSQMHLFSKIIAVTDVYTALGMRRPYRPPHPTNEVLEFMLGSGNVLFDYQIVSEFLRIIKPYDVGSLVVLNSGEIGMVTEIENRLIGKPVVKLLYDKDWRSLYGKEVDLSSDPLYTIKKVIE